MPPSRLRIMYYNVNKRYNINLDPHDLYDYKPQSNDTYAIKPTFSIIGIHSYFDPLLYSVTITVLDCYFILIVVNGALLKHLKAPVNVKANIQAYP